MIILTLLNIAYWIMTRISQAVFPAIPSEVSSVLSYAVGLIQNGLDIVGAWFIDFGFVGPLVSFSIDLWLTLLAVDLVYRVVGFIKLSRKN